MKAFSFLAMGDDGAYCFKLQKPYAYVYKQAWQGPLDQWFRPVIDRRWNLVHPDLARRQLRSPVPLMLTASPSPMPPRDTGLRRVRLSKSCFGERTCQLSARPGRPDLPLFPLQSRWENPVSTGQERAVSPGLRQVLPLRGRAGRFFLPADRTQAGSAGSSEAHGVTAAIQGRGWGRSRGKVQQHFQSVPRLRAASGLPPSLS